MFMRLFVEADNSQTSEKMLKDVCAVLQKEVKKIEIKKNEPYWKMQGIYVLETNIDFINEISRPTLNDFFNGISDKWLFFGDPVDEALASDTNKGCTYIKKGLKMINIFY